jgi:hypothetical protein
MSDEQVFAAMHDKFRAVLPLLERFHELSRRGYAVNVQFCGDTVECLSILGGDPQCSHPKYFDPRDGHGFTFVSMDDVPNSVLDDADKGQSSQDYCDRLFNWMQGQAISLEGLSRGSSVSAK